MWKRKRLIFQAVLAIAIVAGSIVASSMIVHRATEAATYTPTAAHDCKQKQPNNFQCYGKFYAEETYSSGAEAAFKDLESAYNSDDFVKAQCHQLAHIIGRTTYEKYGSLDKTYAQGNNFCWSGFYHGAIEQAATDLGAVRIRQEAPVICQSFANKEKYSFDHFNCVHGLGHGLMAVDDYNLPNALKDCDNLKDNWEQESCYGGVFMENVMVVSRGDGQGAYFKADQPLYPCTFVDAKYKQQCYLMQTSYILQHNGYDFAKTFQECAKADAGFVNTCYTSAGRDASGSTNSDVARTVANCRLAQNDDGLYYCMLGADRDFVSYYHSDQQAIQLCEAFGGNLTDPCKADVADYYKTF